uniref:Uncharacterized protein n=1 Tax=Oryza barthii TaxID=65489 RepID=A0A0D3EW89_9ORYZ
MSSAGAAALTCVSRRRRLTCVRRRRHPHLRPQASSSPCGRLRRRRAAAIACILCRGSRPPRPQPSSSPRPPQLWPSSTPAVAVAIACILNRGSRPSRPQQSSSLRSPQL